MNEIYQVLVEDKKIINALSNSGKYLVSDNVIVKTSRGEQYGRVNAINNKIDIEINDIYIIRKANKKDYNNYLKNLRLSEDMLRFAKQEALKLYLGMNFISADVTLDNKHLLYQFVADERIDFRELAKAIAGKYKLRVELRQIGARDKAKLIDGIGPCGRRLCCTSFLDKLDSISMNMAKNQGLALNPSKINGACGRLMCCLTYENDNYTECRKLLPEVGKMVETEYGIGKVVSEDVLNLKYTVNINNELKEIKVADNGNRKE